MPIMNTIKMRIVVVTVKRTCIQEIVLEYRNLVVSKYTNQRIVRRNGIIHPILVNGTLNNVISEYSMFNSGARMRAINNVIAAKYSNTYGLSLILCMVDFLCKCILF
jgi:hypothetical protein